jgi:threonine synthase
LKDLPENAVIVCTLTGHGLKDVAAVLERGVEPIKAAPTKEDVLGKLET